MFSFSPALFGKNECSLFQCIYFKLFIIPKPESVQASISQNRLLNTQKTKIMVVDKGRERKEDFVLDGEKIEEVESFVYLGSLINT